MARIVITLLPLIFFCAETKAQRLFLLFGHIEYASVTGDLKHTNDNGLGIEAGVAIGANKTFLTGTVGYTWLRSAAGNPSPGTTGTLRYTPVKIGIRRYIFRKNLFLKADAGIANMKYEKASDGSSHLTAGLGAGLKFSGFEVVGDITTTGSHGSWMSIKAGFTIGL